MDSTVPNYTTVAPGYTPIFSNTTPNTMANTIASPVPTTTPFQDTITLPMPFLQARHTILENMFPFATFDNDRCTWSFRDREGGVYRLGLHEGTDTTSTLSFDRGTCSLSMDAHVKDLLHTMLTEESTKTTTKSPCLANILGPLQQMVEGLEEGSAEDVFCVVEQFIDMAYNQELSMYLYHVPVMRIFLQVANRALASEVPALRVRGRILLECVDQ